MRKPATASAATTTAPPPASIRDKRSAELVCLALVLALLALASRIASIW